MRSLIAVVVLLFIVAAPSAFAGDPPGGKGWYQATGAITVQFEGDNLVIANGTPGLLVGVTPDGRLRIQFERGISTARRQEITVDGGFGDALTITVDPTEVIAFVRQPLSKATPSGDSSKTGRGGAATLGPMSGVTGGSLGSPGVNVQRDTTLVVDDTVSVVRRVTTAGAPGPEGPRPGGQLFPPSAPGSGSGGSGKPARVIAREEHDAWLAKVLRLWGEDGAQCETKAYGPGWISICEPRGAA